MEGMLSLVRVDDRVRLNDDGPVIRFDFSTSEAFFGGRGGGLTRSGYSLKNGPTYNPSLQKKYHRISRIS